MVGIWMVWSAWFPRDALELLCSQIAEVPWRRFGACLIKLTLSFSLASWGLNWCGQNDHTAVSGIGLHAYQLSFVLHAYQHSFAFP